MYMDTKQREDSDGERERPREERKQPIQHPPQASMCVCFCFPLSLCLLWCCHSTLGDCWCCFPPGSLSVCASSSLLSVSLYLRSFTVWTSITHTLPPSHSRHQELLGLLFLALSSLFLALCCLGASFLPSDGLLIFPCCGLHRPSVCSLLPSGVSSFVSLPPFPFGPPLPGTPLLSARNRRTDIPHMRTLSLSSCPLAYMHAFFTLTLHIPENSYVHTCTPGTHTHTHTHTHVLHLHSFADIHARACTRVNAIFVLTV